MWVWDGLLAFVILFVMSGAGFILPNFNADAGDKSVRIGPRITIASGSLLEQSVNQVF